MGDTPNSLKPIEIIEFVTEKREKESQSPYKKILKSPLHLSSLLAFFLVYCVVVVDDDVVVLINVCV